MPPLFADRSPPPLPQARPPWIRSGRLPNVGAKTADSAAREAPHRTAQRLCDFAVIATAAAFAVPVGEIGAASRRSSYVALARQCAMYLAHVAFGLSYSEVGRAFGRDRTTAAHACRLIEERRDDAAVDAVMGALEGACAALRRRLDAAVQP
jgi:hypothetical protein